jgi:hypothetical protein
LAAGKENCSWLDKKRPGQKPVEHEHPSMRPIASGISKAVTYV